MKNNFTSERDTISGNLQTIFNASSLKDAFKTPIFQRVIEKQLNLLNFLEKKDDDKNKQSTNLLNRYNELTNKKYQLDKKYDLKDISDLPDEINYLNVYIRNIYKTDLEALKQGKSAKVDTPTVVDQQPQPTSAIPFMIPGMMGGMNNVQSEQNPMYIAAANMKLNQEAAKNNVYLYKTKPKFIPLLKWIIGFGLLISAVFAFFVIGGMMGSANGGGATNVPINYNDDSSHTLADLIGNFSYSLLFLFYGLVAIFAAYKTMVMLIYKKGKFANDNRLYRFSWQTFLFVIFLFIFTVLFDFIAKQPDVYVFLRFNEIFHGENPSSVANWIWFVGYIGLIAGFGIACIAAIVASIYNPKVDVERMNALTKQYIDEFIRNPNPQQPTTPIVP